MSEGKAMNAKMHERDARKKKKRKNEGAMCKVTPNN